MDGFLCFFVSYLCSLTKGYEKHAKRLRKTGEGVDSQEGSNCESYMPYYIMGDGPSDDSPSWAVNLWRECGYYLHGFL
jgi:hypothetical protein